MNGTHKEIEIKLAFDSKAAVLHVLKKQKAKRGDTVHMVDKYYGQKDTDMNNNEHGLLRIRQEGPAAEITYKGKIAGRGDIWKRVELSSSLGDAESMERILVALGFHKVRENCSQRETWTWKRCKIIFVTFTKPAPLKLLEIEGNKQSDITTVVQALGSAVKEFDPAAFKNFDKTRA